MSSKWASSLFLVVVLLTGCSAFTGGGSSSDIEELRARVLELQRRAAVTEVEMRQLKEELAALRDGSPGVVPSPVPAPVETKAQVEETVLADPPMQTVEIEASDLPPVVAPPATSPADELMPLPPPSAQAQELYDRGYTLYHQGRYAQAEGVFQELLSSYRPNELSDNAWYWIGESRWARADVPGALDAFREALERFPRGNKTPDALLKIGQCLERQGDVEEARETYRQLVARYPATAAAAAAQERLTSSP